MKKALLIWLIACMLMHSFFCLEIATAESTLPESVGIDSSAEEIESLQEALICVDMLPEGSVSGVYDSTTIIAVAQFQEWINSQIGEGTVIVSGMADAQTYAYLIFAKNTGMRTQNAVSNETETSRDSSAKRPNIAEIRQELQEKSIQTGSNTENVPAKDIPPITDFYLQSANEAPTEEIPPENGIEDSAVPEQAETGGDTPAENNDMTDYKNKCIPEIQMESSISEFRTFNKSNRGSGFATDPASGIEYTSDNCIFFDWTTGQDVDTYVLELVSPDGEIISHSEVSTENNMLKTTELQPGIYEMRIGAKTPSSEDPLWNSVSFGIKEPEAPANVAAWITESAIRLSWNDASGAESYIIHRESLKDGSSIEIGETEDTVLFDTSFDWMNNYRYCITSKGNTLGGSILVDVQTPYGPDMLCAHDRTDNYFASNYWYVSSPIDVHFSGYDVITLCSECDQCIDAFTHYNIEQHLFNGNNHECYYCGKLPDETEDVDLSVDRFSSPEMVSYIQSRLQHFGFLSDSQITGIYDFDTAEAIKEFKACVCTINPVKDIEINGECDTAAVLALANESYAYERDIQKCRSTIEFKDTVIENAVREELDVWNRDLSILDLYKITRLHISDTSIEDTSDLSHCTNIQDLKLVNCGLTSMPNLRGLQKLEDLDLSNNLTVVIWPCTLKTY